MCIAATNSKKIQWRKKKYRRIHTEKNVFNQRKYHISYIHLTNPILGHVISFMRIIWIPVKMFKKTSEV